VRPHARLKPVDCTRAKFFKACVQLLSYVDELRRERGEGKEVIQRKTRSPDKKIGGKEKMEKWSPQVETRRSEEKNTGRTVGTSLGKAEWDLGDDPNGDRRWRDAKRRCGRRCADDDESEGRRLSKEIGRRKAGQDKARSKSYRDDLRRRTVQRNKNRNRKLGD